MKKQITSVRELAKHCNRSPAAVCAWTKRDDWDFAPAPPWSMALLPRIHAWRDTVLDQDKLRDELRFKHTATDQRQSSGRIGPTWQDIAMGGTPFSIKKKIGDALFCELTVADFQTLADFINACMVAAIIEAAESKGEKISEDAHHSELNAWIDIILEDEELQDLFMRYICFAYKWFCARRWPGREWWKEFPEPIDPPDADMLAEAASKPLPHREKAEASA